MVSRFQSARLRFVAAPLAALALTGCSTDSKTSTDRIDDEQPATTEASSIEPTTEPETVEQQTTTVDETTNVTEIEPEQLYPADFIEATWTLISGSRENGKAIDLNDVDPVTLAFSEDGTISGLASCGTYEGSYSIDSEVISIPEPQKADETECEARNAQVDRTFRTALSEVTEVAFNVNQHKLMLSGESTELEFSSEICDRPTLGPGGPVGDGAPLHPEKVVC